MTVSHNTNLVGDIKSILITGESNVSFLFSSWSVKSVNFLYFDLVKLLACLLDHLLVSSFVDDEDESVVVFDCLDGRLTAQWVFDNSVLVESVVCLDCLEQNLWNSLLRINLWSSESCFSPDLSLEFGVSSFLHSGSCSFSNSL